MTFIKKYYFVLVITLIVAVFFYKFLIFGLLPIPSDSLVGMYHPWRDMYSRQYPRGIPFKNFLTTDPIRQQIPWRKIAIDNWKKGHLPTWNPYSFSGTPLAANSQAAVFYPLNVIFGIFSFSIAWSLLIFFQPLLSGIFMFLYLRNTNIHAFAVWFGTITWMFSGFHIAWMTWGTINHVSLWLPLLLLLIDRLTMDAKSLTKKSHYLWVFILLIGSIFQLLAGHLQISIYVMLLVFIYYIWKLYLLRKSTHHKFFICIFLLYSILFILGSLPFIIPIIKLTLESSRISQNLLWQMEGWFLPWQHLVQFFVPDFFGNPATLNYWGVWNYGEFIGYIGIIPMLFVGFSFLQFKNQSLKFWILTLLLCLLYALPTPLSKSIYQLSIPVLSALQPTRIIVIIDFALSIMTAYGIQTFIQDRNKYWWIPLLSISFLILALWGWIFSIRYTSSFQDLRLNILVSQRNMILPTFLGILGIICFSCMILMKKLKKYTTVIFIILLCITLGDLYRVGWKFIPFTHADYFYPETKTLEYLQAQAKPYRVAILDDELFPSNTLAYYGIESVEGYDSLYSQTYAEFISLVENGEVKNNRGANRSRFISVRNFRSPLFPLLNVKYVISLHEVFDPHLKLVTKEGQTNIYEYALAMPRVYVADTLIHVENLENSATALGKFSARDLKSAVTEAPIPKDINFQSGDMVNLIDYNSTYMRVQTHCQSVCFVVVLNPFDSNWKVYMDNTIVPIYRTNYAFQGVMVQPGEHTLLFNYKLY